jgi:hypothetical protein
MEFMRADRQLLQAQEQLYDTLMRRGKNPLQILEEMRRHLDENYVVVKTDHMSVGPPHRPIHRITLTFGDYNAVGIGYNLKMATHLAAHTIAEEVRPLLDGIAERQREEKRRYQELFEYVDVEMHTIPFFKKQLNRVICASDLSNSPAIANALREALASGTEFGIDMEGTVGGRYGRPARLVQISIMGCPTECVFKTKETWLIRHIDNETDYHPILRNFFEDPVRTKYVFGECDDMGLLADGVVDVVKFLTANDRRVMYKVYDRKTRQHPSLCDVFNLVWLYKMYNNTCPERAAIAIPLIFKNKELTMSNWADPSELSTEQVLYAATDASATLFIGRYFAARRESSLN